MRIRHAFTCLAATTAALALLGACSAEKAGPGSGPDPLATTDGFCTKWAEGACSPDVVEFCGAVDAAACQRTQKSFCLGQLPSSGYSSKFAEQCLTAVKDAYADANLSPEEVGVVLRFADPCDQLVKGPGGDGAMCTDRGDCNTLESLDCVKKAGDDTGECRVPEVVGGGLSCEEPQITCLELFYCDGVHCVARKAIGQSCTSDDECAADARCSVVDADAGAGSCVARLDVTQPCAKDADCKSNICTMTPGGTGGLCVGQVRLSAAEPLCVNLR